MLQHRYIKTTTLVLLLIISPLLLRAETDKKREEINFGAILVLTGEWASWGANCQKALELAREEWNKEAGTRNKPLAKILYEDSPNGRAATGLTAYKKLSSVNGIKYFIGPMAPEEIEAIAPLLERDQTFLLAIGAGSKVNSPSVRILWIDPAFEAEILAKRIFSDGFRKAAVLSSDWAWEIAVSKAFEESFTSLGGEVVTYEELPTDTKDVKAAVLKTRGTNPDVIFIPSYTLFQLYTKEIRSLSLPQPIFSIELDQAAADLAGTAGEGVTFIKPYSATPQAKHFKDSFMQKYKSLPDVPAAQCYDGFQVFMRALTSGNKDPKSIDQYFTANSKHPGASGEIEFKGNRTIMSTSFFVIKNGKVEPEK